MSVLKTCLPSIDMRSQIAEVKSVELSSVCEETGWSQSKLMKHMEQASSLQASAVRPFAASAQAVPGFLHSPAPAWPQEPHLGKAADMVRMVRLLHHLLALGIF